LKAKFIRFRWIWSNEAGWLWGTIMTQIKQSMIEAKVDREIDERVKSGPLKAAKLATFLGLGCVMLGSLMGCTKPNVTTTSTTLTSIKEATLYEDATGALSNGAGQHLFAGSKGAGHSIRGLVAFDVAGKVPAGMTLTAVKLRLTMSAASSNSAQTMGLHRFLPTGVKAAWSHRVGEVAEGPRPTVARRGCTDSSPISYGAVRAGILKPHRALPST
jgi:hypothetical protein